MNDIERLKQRYLLYGVEIDEDQAQRIYDYAEKFAVVGIKGDFVGALLSLATKDYILSIGLSDE